MDSIKSLNFSTISVCDLNTKFNDRCYTDWSKTNLISIVTPDGIYILKPQLDTSDGPFQIDLINNPTTKFQHQVTQAVWPKFDAIWPRLTSQQYMEVFSNPALHTNIATLSSDLYPRKYRIARWSPPLDQYPRECLLAVVTLDCQLLVFQHLSGTWLAVSNLSSDYDRVWCRLHNDGCAKGDFDYEVIRGNILSLSFCCVCWKESNRSGGPILLAATISGDIVMWQVQLPAQTQECLNGVDSPGPLDMKLIAKTNIEWITSMELYEGLLIVSARDGHVDLFDLTSDFNSFDKPSLSTQSRNTQQVTRTLNILKATPVATIWHQDHIEVTDLYIQPIQKEAFRIVIAKSTNICWSINSYVKKENNSSALIGISSSFSAIDSLDPEVSLHQSPATWLRPAGSKNAVLTANDGSFFLVEFMDDGQDASPSFRAINTGNVNLSYMIPRGLCCSPNGHLITMISCVNFAYDPCKLSAPSKLVLVPTVNDKRFLLECIQNLRDLDWIQKEGVTSPMDVCDRIDYLRSIFNLLNDQQLSDLYQTLKEVISECSIPSDKFQLAKLKIFGFIAMKLSKNFEQNDNMIDVDQQVDLDTDVQDVILKVEIERVFDEIFNQSRQDLSKLSSEFQQCNNLTTRRILSTHNFFAWLRIKCENEPLLSKFETRFQSMLSQSGENSTKEICPICQEELPFESLRQGTCRNQHRFERCARSLLIIDPQYDDEIVCEHCKRHYLLELIWPTKTYWLCLFCQ